MLMAVRTQHGLTYGTVMEFQAKLHKRPYPQTHTELRTPSCCRTDYADAPSFPAAAAAAASPLPSSSPSRFGRAPAAAEVADAGAAPLAVAAANSTTAAVADAKAGCAASAATSTRMRAAAPRAGPAAGVRAVARTTPYRRDKPQPCPAPRRLPTAPAAPAVMLLRSRLAVRQGAVGAALGHSGPSALRLRQHRRCHGLWRRRRRITGSALAYRAAAPGTSTARSRDCSCTTTAAAAAAATTLAASAAAAAVPPRSHGPNHTAAPHTQALQRCG